jgi:CRISPR/Cas system-associated exonuclease Cas4 (RecB family)
MNENLLAAIIVSVLVLGAAVIVISSNEAQRRHKASSASTLYATKKDAMPLVAPTISIQGNPTEVVRSGDEVSVIVARKETAPSVLSTSDILRLVAEGMVVEEALGETVSAGIMRFTDREMRVLLTPAIRALVVTRLAELRASETFGPIQETQDPTLCRTCVYRAMCPIGRVKAG